MNKFAIQVVSHRFFDEEGHDIEDERGIALATKVTAIIALQRRPSDLQSVKFQILAGHTPCHNVNNQDSFTRKGEMAHLLAFLLAHNHPTTSISNPGDAYVGITCTKTVKYSAVLAYSNSSHSQFPPASPRLLSEQDMTEIGKLHLHPHRIFADQIGVKIKGECTDRVATEIRHYDLLFSTPNGF